MGKCAALVLGPGLLVGALLYVRGSRLRSEFEYIIIRILVSLTGGDAATGLFGTFEFKGGVVKATGGFGVPALHGVSISLVRNKGADRVRTA